MGLDPDKMTKANTLLDTTLLLCKTCDHETMLDKSSYPSADRLAFPAQQASKLAWQ